MNSQRGFASDNSATIHPNVLAAIARVNVGHTFGYGHDDYTLSVEARVAGAFGEGTGASWTRYFAMAVSASVLP